MTDLDIRPSRDYGERTSYVADCPIDFASWLELGEGLDTELVRGVMIPRLPEPYRHESLFGWLLSTLGSFVEHRNLGIVLGSRTAIKITNNDGRLPNLLFVRADNRNIIHNDAIYGVPDLVIEIISEYDRPSNLIPMEADYCAFGVPEIVFINPFKRVVRHLRRNDNQDNRVNVNGYVETLFTTGRLGFACVPDYSIEVEWLFTEERPDGFTITKQLIEATEAEDRKSIA